MSFDYEKLGFKCGLELHQQLDTTKLFCSCPSEISKKEPQFEIHRRLISVAGETGEVDKAVEYESKKKRDMIYVGDDNSACLVDTDGEPPHEMNKEALMIALRLSRFLKMKPVNEIQVMRKIIADGSVVTGFQRTALIAVNGYVDSKYGKVRVTPLILEEDSCRKVKEDKKSVMWHLDRQGIPLIELRTDPDIKNAEHAKEVAKKLRKISRLVGIKRGIGTIRQDVNISIKGMGRVEIKGVQDVKLIPKVIDKEIRRQLNLIKAGKKVEQCVRRAMPDGSSKYLRPMPGASRMYPETDIPPIRITRQMLREVQKTMPKSSEDRRKEVLSTGIQKHIAEQIILTGARKKFMELIKTGVDAGIVASIVLAFPKKSEEEIRDALLNYKQGKLSKEGVKDILSGKKVKGELLSEEEVRTRIKKIIKKNKNILGDPRAFQKLMGVVMKELRGSADGKIIAQILKFELKD